MQYQARTFNLPSLKGISERQVEVHLALYQGYVKHTNLIMDKIAQLREQDPEGNAYLMGELRRRLGFEFDGMRMHEYYFEQLEDGMAPASTNSDLAQAATERYGSWDGFLAHIREVAGMRGIGWVVVYFDSTANMVHTAWVNDHELGQLAGLPIILALDMWEHAFMVDYVPSQKNLYVEAFFDNLNWPVVEERFLTVSK